MQTDFDKIADEYNQKVTLINSLDNWVFIKNVPKNRDCVLDIGCGTGELLYKLSKYFRNCYGIDNSFKMTEIVQKRDVNFKIVTADANKLPYEDNFFDYIVSHTTFHHLDQELAVEEVVRILKPGGKVIIMDVAREPKKWKRKLEKILLRQIWSTGRMIIKFGLKPSLKAINFLEKGEWRKHIDNEEHLFFTKPQFKQFYSKVFPKGNFGLANSSTMYVVWIKP